MQKFGDDWVASLNHAAKIPPVHYTQSCVIPLEAMADASRTEPDVIYIE